MCWLFLEERNMNVFVLCVLMQACIPNNIVRIKPCTLKKLWQLAFAKLIRLVIISAILFSKLRSKRNYHIPNIALCSSQHFSQLSFFFVSQKSIFTKRTTRFFFIADIHFIVLWHFVCRTGVNITDIVVR